MDNQSNMEQVFQKLGDLKQFFVFGQKIVPVFQKIIDFMHDIVPLLENVNNSIHDSTSKIPKAANQINNVTYATEIATSEILDIVDSMATDMTRIKNELIDLRNGFFNQRVALDRFGDELKPLNGTYDSLKSSLCIDDLENKVISLDSIIRKIENDSSNITISLQVQDITAQQLASVNHLIQSVQKRLASLLFDLGKQTEAVLPGLESAGHLDERSFNENAEYDRTGKHQALADNLMNSSKKASQEEIDKLFTK
ncbi:MAG: protein phosphatase CheZ [Ignavibacteriales bacterium]|nr:protein phosphatase CheZ [Ignavibacteriales bacterium]